MLMPSVSRYMTREPYSIGPTESLATAKALMTRHDIRHVPVVEAGELLGVIGLGDVRVVEAVPGMSLEHVEIADVMSPPRYVWGETPLDEVATVMSDNKAECLVVMGGQGVQGIFTAVDATRALADLLAKATA
jgi:acetoin utilization protein AcuB